MRLFSLAASTDAQMPLIVELWYHLYDNYIVNEAYYEYLGWETQDLINFKIILFALFVGLALAAFGIVYDKRVLGEAVHKLLREECLSPETAKTLTELGYGRSSTLRHSVRKSVSLRRVVKCREEEEFLRLQEEQRLLHEQKRAADKSLGRFKEIPYEFDLETDRFYIPEEMKYAADIKFEKKGSTWLGAILFAVILAVMYVVALVFLPDMLEIVNDFIGSFSGQSNVVV